MKFSIITICYNPGPVVLSAAASVLSQRYAELEYIIVDGGSTDGTVERLKRRISSVRPGSPAVPGDARGTHPAHGDPCAAAAASAAPAAETAGRGCEYTDLTWAWEGKTVRLISEPDQGLYDALNKGVRLATGAVVGFVHADDFLAHPAVLRNLAARFAASGASAVYGDLQYVRERRAAPGAAGGSAVPLSAGSVPPPADPFTVVRHWRSGRYDRKKLAWGWMPPHPSLYVKREIYERARLENGAFFDTSFRCAADYDFMMRILSKYEVEPAYLAEVLVRMRVGGVSNRSLKHILRKSAEDWRAIRRNRIGHLHTLFWKNAGKLGQFAAGRSRKRSVGA